MIDKYHPIDAEVRGMFDAFVRGGRQWAKCSTCSVYMIARDCEEALATTLESLEELAESFVEFEVNAYTNDCTDSTADILDRWRPTFDTRHINEENGRPMMPSLRGADRTVPLADYRNRVREGSRRSDISLVIDPDIRLIEPERLLAGLGEMMATGHGVMAAQQLAYIPEVSRDWLVNYDAFAWRPSWTWHQSDQRELSFFHDVRPVGAPAYQVNSAFGGAAWYRADSGFMDTPYDGTDGCEHVGLHRGMAERHGRRWTVAVSPAMTLIR